MTPASRHSRLPKHASSGFTMTEWLIVVAVLSVLTAVLVPVISKMRESARRAACAENLRTLGNALQLYAVQNDDRLPVIEPVGNSPWDISVNVAQELMQHGVERDHFYCPSGPMEAREHLWNFREPDEDGGGWNRFHVIGYVLLLEGAPRVLPEFTNSRALPAVRESDEPSDRELGVDAVMSATGGRHGSFDSRTVGGNEVPDRTNHLNGERPAGGNVLYLDGHVAWRDFEEMDNLKVKGIPVFWW